MHLDPSAPGRAAAGLLTGLLAAVPLAAAAQTSNLVAERPPAIAVPYSGVASAEEPAGLSVNPAAPGFVRLPSLQYFHEFRNPQEDDAAGEGNADAVFLSLPLGALVPTLALDWVRPPDASRFRRTTVGLAVGNREGSFGWSYTWYHSPNAAIEPLKSWSIGGTARPLRWLSAGWSLTDAGLDGFEKAWIVGAAFRGFGDRVTLSGDWLFREEDLAVGLTAAVWRGLFAGVQVQLPLASGLDPIVQVALTSNHANSGITGAWADDGERPGGTFLLGARVSGEAYRGPDHVRPSAVQVDLADALRPRTSFLFGGERDLFGRLLGRLRTLREDSAVRSVAIVVDDLDLGFARTGELRTAIQDLAARKRVVALLRGGRLAEYWLATAAKEIHAPEAVDLEVTGIATQVPFLRTGLEKIGVGFDVVAAGRYKSAPDPLVRRDMSEAQREAASAILDALYGRIVADVAQARGLDEASVRAAFDRGLFTSRDAITAKLLDGTAWPDEVEKLAKGGQRIGFSRSWSRPPPREAERWGPRPAIAIVPLEGAIVQGRGGSTILTGRLAGGDAIAEQIRRAAADRDVRAIVLRVDSPGGDALASDYIWRAVRQAREKGKPVVASFADSAASGGYLAAVGADEIVAEPSTLTGSIGVFVVKPDLSGLLGKIGVNVVTLKRGEHADLRSGTRAWTEDERRLVERHVQAFYEGFKRRVAEGRNLTDAQVEEVAGGRVWTGAEAKARGLVDRLGGLEDALRAAQERAGLLGEAVELRRFEPPRRFLDGLSSLTAEPDAGALVRAAASLPEIRTAALLAEVGPLVALPVDWLGPSEAAAAPPPVGGRDLPSAAPPP